MSKAERLSLKIEETKRAVFGRDNWRCVVCGNAATQCAHVLGQTDMNIARYGEAVIHHPMNLRSVCGLAHNKIVEISTKSRPIEAAQHAAKIKRIIEEERC
jgi:hypothetical protein